jgi:hypothetical protein
MWHYLRSKKTNFGYGRLIVTIPVNSLTGNVGIVIKEPSPESKHSLLMNRQFPAGEKRGARPHP